MFKKLFRSGQDKPQDQSAPAEGASKLSKPKDIFDAVGRDLVIKHQQDPDWVWKLKQVNKPSEQGKHIRDFRVYDPVAVGRQGVKMRDYHSLDDHPELIVCYGWLNLKEHTAQVLVSGGEQQRAS